MFYIYLKCNNASGYYTGTILTSTGEEICIHSNKLRGKTFNTKQEAYSIASQLKYKFTCVHSYLILN